MIPEYIVIPIYNIRKKRAPEFGRLTLHIDPQIEKITLFVRIKNQTYRKCMLWVTVTDQNMCEKGNFKSIGELTSCRCHWKITLNLECDDFFFEIY